MVKVYILSVKAWNSFEDSYKCDTRGVEVIVKTHGKLIDTLELVCQAGWYRFDFDWTKNDSIKDEALGETSENHKRPTFCS
jgi:hypothetical protein